MEQRNADLQGAIARSSTPADVFRSLSFRDRREVFFSLPESVAERLISDMDHEQLKQFVGRLDPDDARDVLEHATADTRSTVLSSLDAERRKKIDFLLSFDPESAAGLMDLDYVTVEADRTIGEVAERVRQFEARTSRIPTVLVTQAGRVLGEVRGGALSISAAESTDIVDIVEEIPQVRYDRDDADVLDVFTSNRDRTVVVLDAEDAVLGVIHADDLLTVLESKTGETLYEFTGVAEAENVLDGPAAKVRSRYKWLIVNLGTAFLAAAVVGLFESTIATIAVLAAYMPVVAGMGGNAGTQAMAVTVRGISLGHVTLSTGKRAVANEIVAGAVNGLITGVLVAAIAIWFSLAEFGILLGAVIGVSMVANLVIAGFFGAVIPLVLDEFGIDPATSAMIFITTATDVLGFLVFLGLARTVLL